jgi:hypothetical protein
MVSGECDGMEVCELLKCHTLLEHRRVKLSEGEVLVRIHDASDAAQ